MSQENVEVVRRFLEAGQRSLEAYWKNPRPGAAALEAGDLAPEQDEVLAFLHPEVEVYTRGIALQGGAVRGHLGWLRMWDDILAASDHYRITLRELADLGGGEVLAAVELAVKWKASGMEQADTVWYLATLRSGLLVRVDAYLDREEALEAAGLSEQKNIKVVRRIYELMSRRDIAGGLQLLAPDFVLDLSSIYPDAPVLRGADELLRWIYSGPWGGSAHMEAERFFDVDNERVLAFVRVTATGEGSGVPVELRDAHELTIREGLLVRCKVHPDRDAALEAAGLSEQDAHADS